MRSLACLLLLSLAGCRAGTPGSALPDPIEHDLAEIAEDTGEDKAGGDTTSQTEK